jgi:hypothetical protein
MDFVTDLQNMAVWPKWNKQDFNFQKHIFGKSFQIDKIRRIEEIRRLWNIVKYRASLLLNV